MTKSDPIGTEYYSPLRSAEIGAEVLFYIAAALSIAALQVDKATYSAAYDGVQSLFAVSVLAVFVLGLAVRLYWSTRAHVKRVSDFISSAFDVALISQPSAGYYNNAEVEPFRRVAASLMENTLFSKSILQKMLVGERIKVAIYAAVWLFAALTRATDLALIAAVAQVIFSEQIISRWVRMEWLRNRVEQVYEDIYSLVQPASNRDTKEFKARTVECLMRYETGKAQAGISLSTRLFKRLNPVLTKQWDETARRLHI
jgi:hypothetical protein